ncbi:hypothetical protein Rsub_13351 [Raphidocelis subcapitata]|uniref:Uncharacterized protein n=1 Tax=Raphidocelis subcapitata TaxID=307507 RepID=A0A2V0PR33_9CHLO|nr:hypothetical protein Rsub_13351 [Raphidocelis subcapitata]|eukprot:GBG00561.1 hypothetical protein Rsub_13351 [Raphidocelis subcapitata]
MSSARMARAAALLLVLCAAGPAAASRSPSALWGLAGYGSAGRSLLQDQASCCALVDATATGGTMTCGPSGLVMTVPSVQFAPIAASISVTGKSGNTAALTTTALYGQTCSSRFGAATWGSAGSATTLAVAAGSDTTCTTGTEGTCQGLVNELGPVTNSAIAGRHSCTIRAGDGAVLCSGNNQFGQLGTGTATASTSLVAALVPGSGSGALTGATKIAVGGRPEGSAASGHTCACLSSGEAVCWGMNTFGQVAAAIPTTTTRVARAAYVVTNAAGSTRLAGCKSVAANLNHTMFLTSTGDIYGAGRNGYSELGLGTAAVTNYAAQVPRSSVNGLAAIAISAGKRHTCAVFEDNTIACVGGNGNGQLGRGFASGTASADWGFVSGINDAVDVQCGELSTCVLRKGGKVSCWGLGIAVGNGGATATTPFETLSGGAVSIASGDQHVCALMDDITVQCWCVGWELGGMGLAAGLVGVRLQAALTCVVLGAIAAAASPS